MGTVLPTQTMLSSVTSTSSARPVVEVQSVAGKKFFFDIDQWSYASGLAAAQWTNKVFTVQQMRRNAAIWTGQVRVVKAVGHDASGERVHNPANGQWACGDILTFV